LKLLSFLLERSRIFGIIGCEYSKAGADMPILPFARRLMSAGDLLRGLDRGTISPCSLTSAEQTELRLHGKRVLKRLRIKIRRLRDRSERIARREQRSLFRNTAVRLFAAYVALRKKSRRSTSCSKRSAPPSFERVWRLANQLARLNVPATAIRLHRPKARGGFRTVYDFDEFGAAKQEIVLYALQPFAGIRPLGFDLARGQLAACEELLKAMNSAPAGTRFIQFDVRDCYGSISVEWLRSKLPLSRAIIDGVVLQQGYRIIDRSRVPVRPSASSRTEAVTGEANADGQRGVLERGILQGSAVSPVIADMTMIDVLRSAASVLQRLKVFSHSDNIGVLVPPHIDTAVLEKSLSDAFQAHPAGPFALTSSGPRVLSQPFRFLGYDFVKPPHRHARAVIPPGIAELREAAYYNDIADAGDLTELAKVRSSFTGYCGAFQLDDNARFMRERLDRMLDAEILYRKRICALQ
jgi:hypothetical protein